MAILNSKFKDGADRVFGSGGVSADENETDDVIIDFIGCGIAQNAYQILQSNNVFENKDFLAADEFVDSNGTNNTVNTGSSTATYAPGSDEYQLSTSASGTDNTATAATMATTSTGETTERGYVFVPNNDCFIVSATKNSSATVTRCRIYKSGSVIATATFVGDVATFSSPIEILNDGSVYTIESDNSGASFTRRSTTTVSYPYNNTDINFTDSSTGGSAESNPTVAFNIESVVTQTAVFDSSSNVICDSNIKTLNGNELSICVYADVNIPTDTTLTVDISDGTTTLSAQPINEVLALNGFTSGTLELTFNLATTDSAVTPTIKGYGVYIK